MADKLPQPTQLLIRRLRRVAKHLDGTADERSSLQMRARANVCWQAAARLEQLHAPRAGYEAYLAKASEER